MFLHSSLKTLNLPKPRDVLQPFDLVAATEPQDFGSASVVVFLLSATNFIMRRPPSYGVNV
jgi:hypothetical protein